MQWRSAESKCAGKFRVGRQGDAGNTCRSDDRNWRRNHRLYQSRRSQGKTSEIIDAAVYLVGIDVIVKIAEICDRQCLKNVPAPGYLEVCGASEPARLREPG